MGLTLDLICYRVSNTNVYVDRASEVSFMPRKAFVEKSIALAANVGALLPLAALRPPRWCGGRH